jgi:LysR family glycine cleavage system transcriptional activator
MATLEAFAAAGRSGSFSAAADALHLTPGAISRQMASLEADVGVPLFKRHARGVSLTPSGKRLYAAVQEAMTLIVTAAADLRSDTGATGVVTLSVTPSFGARWLLPRLPRFTCLHPALRVAPVADNRVVDLDAEGFDFAVRYTAGRVEGLEAVRLMEEELSVVGSPALLQNLDLTLEALATLPLLHDTSDAGWRRWLGAMGRPDLLPSEGIVFNDYNLAIEAAVAGLGLIIGRSMLIAEELRSGRLVEPFAFQVPSASAYYLVRRPGPLRPAAQALWDWLLQIGRAP